MRRMIRSVACAAASLVTRSTGGGRNGSPRPPPIPPELAGGAQGGEIGFAATHREGAERAEGRPQDRPADHLALRHVHRIAWLNSEGDSGRVGVVQVVARHDGAALSRDVLATYHLQLPAVDQEAELIEQDDALAVGVD